MWLKWNVLIFCCFFALKIEIAAADDNVSSEDSLSSSSSDEAHMEVMIRAGEAMMAKPRKPEGITKNYLTDHLFDTDSSSEKDDGSIFCPNEEDDDTKGDKEGNEVSSGVSEDLVDGCIILSTAREKKKKKKYNTSGTKCSAIEAPSASVVSNLTFYSNATSRSHSRESTGEASSVNCPSKKKRKGEKGKKVRVNNDRCATLTDKTMDPYNGQLRCRLSHNLMHWPIQVKSIHRNCQMHYWLYNKKHRAQLMHCPACNVTLCLDCYKPFHETPNICRP